MKMETTSYGSRPVILAADDYTAVPFNAASAAVKAGEVVESVKGIALYDVAEGENGAAVVAGVIDALKASKAATGTANANYYDSATLCGGIVIRKGIANQEGE